MSFILNRISLVFVTVSLLFNTMNASFSEKIPEPKSEKQLIEMQGRFDEHATVIRFLGNAEFVKNISNEKDLVIDEYTKNGKKIDVYYSLGEKNKFPSPEGEYEAYDMYGNPIEIGGKITVTNSPIYIIY